MAAGSQRAPDVLIVGAGAIGVAAAYELAGRGVDVLLVEARDTVGAECSYGNAGLISPSHCIPLARPGVLREVPGWLRPGGPVHIRPRLSADLVRFGVLVARSSHRSRMIAGLRGLRDLARASRDLFEDLAAAGLSFGYRRDGVMNVCATVRSWEALQQDAELLRREGFEPEVMDAEAARTIEPSLRADIAGAVRWAEDAHCEPGLFVAELARAARERGARFEFGARVTGFERSQDGSITAVRMNGRILRPKTVVLSAGSWTAPLARLAGTRIPLEAAKGYHVELAPGAAPRLQVPLIFQESVFAATPMGGGLRLAGTMEFVGLDPRLSEHRARRLLHEASSYLNGLDDPGDFTTWCGLRPCTPDSLPIVGWSVRVPNLLLATGHAMLGITLAPVTGRIIGELVRQTSSELAAHALAPSRYRA